MKHDLYIYTIKSDILMKITHTIIINY